MMAQIKQIATSFSMLLVFWITGATGGFSFVVRRGDDATLSCANLNMHECGQIGFIFTVNSYSTDLVQGGQIKKNGKVTTDRLRMTEHCSLVIKEVKPEDAGDYYCHQSRPPQTEYTLNWLSVVSIDEQEVHEETMLTCSVSTYTQCKHSVKWLYGDNEVTEDTKDIGLSQTTCRSVVTFKKLINTESLICQVEDKNINVFCRFPFRPRSSGRDTTPALGTTEGNKSPTSNSRTHAMGHSPISGLDWWWYIAVAVGLVVILVIVIVIIRWRRNKGCKQKNSGVEVNLHTAEYECAAEKIEDTVDPESGICYASVNYTKKTKSKNHVQDMVDEEETVTYSAVKYSRSSDVTSTNLNDIYATVKK